MTERRVRRWYECLSTVKPEGRPTKAEAQGGRDIHKELEAAYPDWKQDQPSVYHDESLPFDIIYHPDLYDEATGTVVEIKPYWWFWDHLGYCIAQISGYKHFKQAQRAIFRLYKADKEGNVKETVDIDPPYLLPWDQLRQIALDSDLKGIPA